MIPGMNLLNIAGAMIDFAVVQYYQYTGRSVNTVGQYIGAFADPVPLRGSLQAVPRSLYEQHGLDWSKKYVILYVSENTTEIQRNVAGDQFTYAGQRYQVESATDWFWQDGWKGVLASYFSDD